MDLYNVPNLDAYIAENLVPTAGYLERCNTKLNRLIHFLVYYMPHQLRPKKVIKSGSLVKGTALKGRSDIDLILMLTSFTDVGVLMENMDTLLETLKTSLAEYNNVKIQTVTRYSVQIQFSCHSDHIHDIDLLLAVDFYLDEQGDPQTSLDTVYQKMKKVKHSYDKIHEYSVSLVPLQTGILEGTPQKLKDLIRLLKHWEYVKSGSTEGRDTKWPNSYTMELIALQAWIKAGKPKMFDTTRALHAILTALIDHRNFKIIFYDRLKYSRSYINPRYSTFIMDPTNPYNDMYHGFFGKAWDWDMVAREAQTWLKKPLLRGLEDSECNWGLQ